jgi:hypothetical protein
LAAGTAQASIVIDGFSSPANDRFAHDASFIGAGHDWSGVGRTTSVRWGTLVSRNVFVSATHYHPGNGATFKFYPGNDPDATPVVRTVTAGQRIGNTDLWVGALDAPVPAGIATYAVAPWAIADEAAFQASPLYLQNSWMWGLSPTDYSDTTVDMALGRNKLDGWMNDRVEGASTNDVTIAKWDASGDANFVSSEAYLRSGDSGGPMFVLGGGGDLVLAGINWSINEGGVQNSVFTYTGSYAGEIQDFIDANPVPEPCGTPLGAFLAAVALFGRRRGRSSAGD